MNAIIYSVWKCRGNWYVKVWGLLNGCVLDIAPNYRGTRSQQEAMERALACVDLVRRKYPEAADLPAVMEHSEQWRSMLAAQQQEVATTP